MPHGATGTDADNDDDDHDDDDDDDDGIENPEPRNKESITHYITQQIPLQSTCSGLNISH